MAYKQTAKVFPYSDPTVKHIFHQHVIGYIDDNTLIFSFRRGESVATVLQEAQIALALWKKSLNITGGDLALEKCLYSYMGWVHKKGEECVGKIEDFSVTITTKTTADDPVIITGPAEPPRVIMHRIEATTVERILGVRLGSDNSDATKLKYRLHEATVLTRHIT